MKSVAEAMDEVLAAFEPLGAERVALGESLGRYTAEEIRAPHDLPPFDNSAMDGFAVVSADLAGARADARVQLKLCGESRAGSEVLTPVVPGSAQRIFTGAPLPPGADAVELQENVTRIDDQVAFSAPLEPFANVRRKGSDIVRGELVLSTRAELGPGEIALLASLERASIHVYRRPRVAIVCTGDELRDIGEPARPGSIINSNAYALAAQTRAAGAEPWLLPPARDERDDIARTLRQALMADVVVLSGGVSVGDYDLVHEALREVGVTLAFWKVRMKPGKPLSFAQHGRIPILGLPGNPVSAWVTFELFVRPGLRRMLGAPQPLRPRLTLPLLGGLRRKPGRTEFARARLQREGSVLCAKLLAQQGSGALSSLIEVHALVEIPEDCEVLAPGSEVQAWLLRDLPA